MRQERKRHEITFKKTVYDIPGMDTVKIRPDVTYDDGGPDPLSMDLYYPKGATEAVRLPAVNHRTAPHSFDLLDTTEASREVTRQIGERMLATPARTAPAPDGDRDWATNGASRPSTGQARGTSRRSRTSHRDLRP
jgi:hypothetical protein